MGELRCWLLSVSQFKRHTQVTSVSDDERCRQGKRGDRERECVCVYVWGEIYGRREILIVIDGGIERERGRVRERERHRESGRQREREVE